MLKRFFLMLCFALVSLSVSFIVAKESPEKPALGKFEGTVRNYAYRDIDNPPIPGCSLFIGSSSFAIWGKKLEERFAEYDAVNRGFGGSQIFQNVIALDRIHLPYKPARITVFCGTNDIAHGKSTDRVFSDFKYYIARHWNENPFAEIYFVSLTHAPVREKFWELGDQLNDQVKALAAQTPGLYFIDIITPMKGEDGRVREDLFVKDRLHLNDAGYDIWYTAFKKTFEEQDSVRTNLDIRELFKTRKQLGLFDDPRFADDRIIIKQPPEKDVKLNIVFIGDSITIGGGDKSPPNRCAEYLKKQAGIADVASSNQGVSGFTTVDFLPSQNKRFPKVVEAANAFKEDKDGQLIFSIMLGTNDSAIRGPNGSPVSPENYRKNMREIIDKLLADYPGSKVVLHRPVWYSDNTQNTSSYLLEGQLRVSIYTEELRRLVDWYNRTTDSGRVFLGDMKAFNYFKTHHQETMHHENGEKGTFFLHPNDRGADVLGRFWGAAIQKAL